MALKALYDVPAPAKLNLFLHVVGRRADGLHLLQSPFVLIDWADTLHFELRSDGALMRHDLSDALPEDDLCLRAARALQADTGCTAGADISISKQVPSAAGMGGGSSDAATTLLALNRLWKLKLSRARLSQLGLQLGADVPFFIEGRNAFVEGVGERLTPLELPEMRFAVLKPLASLATREIFEHPRLVRNTERVILFGFTESARATAAAERVSQITVDEMVQGFGHNDLQGPAEDRSSQVAQAAGLLVQMFGNSRMTGSGSAVFARVSAPSDVGSETGTFEKVEAQWPAAHLPPGWVGRMCSSLAQHPLLGWAD